MSTSVPPTGDLPSENVTMTMAMTTLKVTVVDVVSALFFFLAMVFVVGGNGLVIAVIVGSRAYRQLAYKLVAMLAVADCGVGLSICVRIIWLLYPRSMSIFIICQMRFWFVETAQISSLLILFGISVERFIGVFLPLRYPEIVRPDRVTAFMVVLVAYSLIFSLPTIAGEMRWHDGQECEFFLIHGPAFIAWSSTNALIILVAMTLIYAAIARQALKQRRHIAALEAVNQSTTADFHRKMHTIKVFAIVVGICIICWLPFPIMSWVRLIYGENAVHDPRFIIGLRVSAIAMAVNSAVNPVIYVLRMKSFKLAMKNIIKCKSIGSDLEFSNTV